MDVETSRLNRAMNDVSRILSAIERGDPMAADELLPLVYEELRKLAVVRMGREAHGQTLQATALVLEAYLRLVGKAPERRWENSGHFFAAAAEAMRRILVERAQRKRSRKHGGELSRTTSVSTTWRHSTTVIPSRSSRSTRCWTGSPRNRRARPSW